MNYDREADILYLAHQLWEERDAPGITAQSCWTQAALQMLARPRKADAPTARVAWSARYQRYVQPGLALCIDHGVAQPQRRITFVSGDAQTAANRPVSRIRRLAD